MDRVSLSQVPIMLDRALKNSSSATLPPYSFTLAALHSFFIPDSPQTSTPWDQDCSRVINTMPREPKCEYRSGRSLHRHTLAASSRTPTSGVLRRPSPVAAAAVVEDAMVSAASTTATVKAVTNGPAVPWPSLDKEYRVPVAVLTKSYGSNCGRGSSADCGVIQAVMPLLANAAAICWADP